MLHPGDESVSVGGCLHSFAGAFEVNKKSDGLKATSLMRTSSIRP